ncbi:unnamed protein product, partial [Polarella glacialis]
PGAIDEEEEEEEALAAPPGACPEAEVSGLRSAAAEGTPAGSLTVAVGSPTSPQIPKVGTAPSLSSVRRQQEEATAGAGGPRELVPTGGAQSSRFCAIL